ncbi:MAG TPA: hemerythrin domain-containing protein [Lamprocystis sp. (in: g-proteobacteria)]|nr:hemerythrin domain-containing protein [Lamprocystis sp. (in: g-proteobacteria)]
MSRLLVWREEWSLGIDALDADHRALFGTLIDISLRFCPQAAGPATVRGITRAPETAACAGSPAADLVDSLTAFGAQFRAHIRREEAFMRAIHYPQLAAHAAKHAVLLTQFSEMLSDWRASGNELFDESAQEFVRHWLLTHVLESDRSFANAYFDLCGLEEPGVDQG